MIDREILRLIKGQGAKIAFIVACLLLVLVGTLGLSGQLPGPFGLQRPVMPDGQPIPGHLPWAEALLPSPWHSG